MSSFSYSIKLPDLIGDMFTKLSPEGAQISIQVGLTIIKASLIELKGRKFDFIFYV